MGRIETFPTVQPMPAVVRILARYDRQKLEAFLTIALDLLDTMDGDTDIELEEPEEDDPLEQDDPTEDDDSDSCQARDDRGTLGKNAYSWGATEGWDEDDEVSTQPANLSPT